MTSFPLSYASGRGTGRLPFPRFSLPFSLYQRVTPSLTHYHRAGKVQNVVRQVNGLFQRERGEGEVYGVIGFIRTFSRSGHFVQRGWEVFLSDSILSDEFMAVGFEPVGG